MSSFFCTECSEPIIDTPIGYVTACEHHPLSSFRVGQHVIVGDTEWIVDKIEDGSDPLDSKYVCRLCLIKRDEMGEITSISAGIRNTWIDRIVYVEKPSA